MAGATEWLRDLDDLVAGLERDWSLRVGEAFGGGTEALVARATLDDGTAAVLKLLVPRVGGDAETGTEAAVLGLTGGDACARLLRSDLDRGALLMERLGPSLHDLALPFDTRIDLLCDLVTRFARPAADLVLESGAEQADWLAGYVAATWESLGRPCHERAVQHALDCAGRRRQAHDDERALLVHGDVHQWNTLLVPGRDAAEGAAAFRLVDPNGLRAQTEYDLGVLMREDPVDLLRGDPRDRSRRLAARTGLDEVAIWEWGVVERVSTGLVCLSVGLDEGRDMLHAAEVVAGS